MNNRPAKVLTPRSPSSRTWPHGKGSSISAATAATRDANPDVRLTFEHVEAMVLIEAITNDPAFHVEMDFKPGDVQLLNNSVMLPSREVYQDQNEQPSIATLARRLPVRSGRHAPRGIPVRD